MSVCRLKRPAVLHSLGYMGHLHGLRTGKIGNGHDGDRRERQLIGLENQVRGLSVSAHWCSPGKAALPSMAQLAHHFKRLTPLWR